MVFVERQRWQPPRERERGVPEMALFNKVGCNIGSNNATVTIYMGPATIVWRPGDNHSTVRTLEGVVSCLEEIYNGQKITTYGNEFIAHLTSSRFVPSKDPENELYEYKIDCGDLCVEYGKYSALLTPERIEIRSGCRESFSYNRHEGGTTIVIPLNEAFPKMGELRDGSVVLSSGADDIHYEVEDLSKRSFKNGNTQVTVTVRKYKDGILLGSHKVKGLANERFVPSPSSLARAEL